MCGVFGIVYRDVNRVPDRNALVSTSRLLGHRGPDNSGIHSGPGIGLVHTRLSLVDLDSRSDQPLWNEKRTSAIVYNGEVYNFRELASRLTCHLRTTSDTEVVHEWLSRGNRQEAIRSLDGMFAFGIWNDQDQELFLGRDRFGIKPLYYLEDDTKFIFASEIKALKPWIQLEADLVTVSGFFLSGVEPTRHHSFFRDVRVLSPGTTLRFDRRGPASTQPFFPLTDFLDPDIGSRFESMNAEQVTDWFEERLSNAVQRQLLADAPVGALCSGGVDSSLIMSLATKSHDRLAIFHANVVGRLSEHPAAVALAKHLGLDLQVVDVTDDDYLEHIPDVVEHYEYPFAYHGNSLAFMLVTRLVRKSGVKAVLTGEGSDECFLGYPRMVVRDLLLGYYKTMERLRRGVQSIPKLGDILLPPSRNPPRAAVDLLSRCEHSTEMAQLQSDAETRMGRVIRDRDARSIQLLTYHLRTLLHRNDALGMEASIEARFPFLDHEVVRGAVNLPYRFKVRKGIRGFDWAHPLLIDKWVIRSIADRHLPPELSRRRKLGFPTDALRRMRVDALFYRESAIAEMFQLNRPAMSQLLEQESGSTRVSLLLLEIWARLFLRDISCAKVRQDLHRHASFVGTAGR
ncbi:MAG: asparagine synthase (glutamine-hydrolyzing) [Acidobacteriota bacterium]|nr:asparagine synthase (glutamine-hydrolyzing) [Acidobacteriota bacterium]MDH3783727.1 asparagine synthase (glutamine-hydrolyzing) [Acidobacteriota bacterium]